jgi:hypothetical protein
VLGGGSGGGGMDVMVLRRCFGDTMMADGITMFVVSTRTVAGTRGAFVVAFSFPCCTGCGADDAMSRAWVRQLPTRTLLYAVVQNKKVSMETSDYSRTSTRHKTSIFGHFHTI